MAESTYVLTLCGLESSTGTDEEHNLVTARGEKHIHNDSN